ncbi:signal peptidase I [Patiriisocius marinistellae]|uniref:Signal peptidase I n=1 Tax=Patiriisocius marinistellae TaxID=2494560 RepID=A0A5J4G0Q0_9FLAO|nr:signal peptidase I [Patiriisocius marinistellae]GEQ86089.1 signal peptidase I [Patiriisocius marinistellae]
MSWTGWLLLILIVQVIHFLGTWKLYVAAGRKAWEAAVPVYNAVVLMKIINRPWWWTILLFVPIVNLIMFPVVWVETIRSFGKNSPTDTALAILTLGLYIYYINYTQKLNYIEDRSLKPRTSTGEWVSSILFAVVAATIVHTYVMQPFTIPTSSLEKTLLVGDFLFVSKFHYGARTPNTPISFPMVHDTIPKLGVKSYSSKPQIPYFRVPGFQDISRNDIVVFNWPVDTLVDINPASMRGSVQKPIDKKSNYVKRCVGVPGDSLEVRAGYVYINGEKNVLPDRAKLQFYYGVIFKRQINQNDIDYLRERYDITDISADPNPNTYIMHMTDEAMEQFKSYKDVAKIIPIKNESTQYNSGIFPHSPDYAWNNDFFGPIYIPEAGKTVTIDAQSIPFYKRIIETYEGSELGIENKITQNGTQVLLNGQPLTDYTFKMDYYWMMGDNRNNSQDARSWGYVPFNHVVGKPVFVWMSWDSNANGLMNKIRWERLFTTVGGSGKPVSYFIYFLIALGGYLVFNYFRKKKKATK